MKSFSFYLTLFLIRIKGLKREFSKDPIDYKSLRKADVHNPDPKKFLPHRLEVFSILDTTLTSVRSTKKNDYLILFCPGGAFVYGPSQHHWDVAKKMVSATNCDLWMIDYPKAPEHKIAAISSNIDAVYHSAIQKYPAGKIILMGDSAGGTLLTALTQRLIVNNIPNPEMLILISPIMDSTFSASEITEIEKTDPILSKKGVLSAKKMCAGNKDLQDPSLSPLNGSYKNFPSVLMFIAEKDISAPGQIAASQKMTSANVDLRLIFGKDMPHIWPLLPVMKEAKEALQEVIRTVNKFTQSQ